MTLNNAYCFCPNFLSIASVQSIMEALLQKRHSVFLDNRNKLMEEYTRILSRDVNAFSLYTILDNLPNSQKLISPVNLPQIDSNFLLQTVTGYATTDTKFLASADRVTHNSITQTLQLNNVREIYPHNFTLTFNSTLHRSFNINEFKVELEHSLSLVMGERRGKLENEYNTTLANCLRAKRYIVLDQTLHGSSLTRISMGSLDLVIQDGTFKTIIEPLRLSGMESDVFYTHLNKLLDNYNPLRIEHTFLVVYYRGRANNFRTFVSDYKERLDQLDVDQLNNSSSWLFEDSTFVATEFDALHSLEQTGTINGSPFTCTHLIADFSEN